MFEFAEHPGLLFVWATLLPLASFLILLLAGALRCALRPHRADGGLAAILYDLLGGEVPGKGCAYVSIAGIGLACCLCVTGFVLFLTDPYIHDHHAPGAGGHGHTHGKEEEKPAEAAPHHETLGELQAKIANKQHSYSHATGEAAQKISDEITDLEFKIAKIESRWAGSLAWTFVQPRDLPDPDSGTELRIGYRIDHLSAIMFVMVTFIATLIHIFSMGYMSDELRRTVEDHEVHTSHGHYHRRGRFGRFFLFLSLFCFSMLNLLLADNLFQIFVSWELVGVCSYLLIGFYFERTSASNAANKAFITNRIGDAGFIIGVLILWTYVGTLNFQEIFQRIRAPEQAFSASEKEHGSYISMRDNAQQIVTGKIIGPAGKKASGEPKGDYRVQATSASEPRDWGTQAILFPRTPLEDGHFHSVAAPGGQQARNKQVPSEINTWKKPPPHGFGTMPYWMLVLAGLGIFLGCVGKSAQFPLQVWLPDAMEGPTPVSALIHAATMVAAGVYLVGRCYPLFTSEVLLTIAYIGGITLFVAATIAVVQTDIKKVLAYSTVSQLGYMMLGLGVGGWAAGLFHLVTHAFFKALLFLCSGSVIYGCHHVQDMGKMGGLYPKMKTTALAMLVGCLAIAGIPLFSGWYSKDAIVAQALGFSVVHSQHFLLFLLPLLTAGLTTFYMFRMWFMTFTGEPRDLHVYEHAHESPRTMTVPLVILAFFSVVVAWGWPVWDAENSWLEHQLHHAQPHSVIADFGGIYEVDGGGPAQHIDYKSTKASVRAQAHARHGEAGFLALAMVAIGLTFAFVLYYYRALDPGEAKGQFPGVHGFLSHKWYFDEIYSAIVVRPALRVSGWARAFDTYVIDGFVHLLGRVGVATSVIHGWFDRNIVDGAANLIANVSYGIGAWLRGFQTGYLRSYILFLVLAAVGIWVVMLFVLGTPAPAGR